MGSLLGSVSQGFAKPVVLGSMFPVLILGGLDLIVIVPLLSFGEALNKHLLRVATGEQNASVIVSTFVVVVLTGLLYNLNTPIIRLHEGYPFERSFVGQTMAARWKLRFRRGTSLRLSLRFLGRELRRRDINHPQLSDIADRQTALAQILNDALPDREDLILPTRLGNAIRSFERYPVVAYEMDGIALWPRLVAKVDATFASTIEDAKTMFDFMLNCSFLSTLTTLAITVLWLRDDAALISARSGQWAWRAALFGSLAILFYTGAVSAAIQWGVQVRAAFDLYRFDLLKSLGYKQVPTRVCEERALWQLISRRLVFADSEELPEYDNEPTRVTASPPGIQVAATRSVSPRAHGGFDITLTVRNVDVFRRAARDLLLVETVPENYQFIVGSLSASSSTIVLRRVQPLEVKLDTLEVDKDVIVKYAVRPGV